MTETDISRQFNVKQWHFVVAGRAICGRKRIALQTISKRRVSCPKCKHILTVNAESGFSLLNGSHA